MNKLLSVLIATTFLAALPVTASDRVEVNKSKGKTVDEILVHQEKITDPKITSEQKTQGYWRRYCPPGYYLVRYYYRVGNVWVVQYRCVRYYGRYPWSQPPQVQQQVD